MAEYINNKEELINVGEPIIFENKTEASFDVSVGIVFRKSGLYRVSVYGRNISVQKESGEPFSADVQSVVRCKDCVYQTESWSGIKYCEAHGDHIGKDYDYCSNARRKENG